MDRQLAQRITSLVGRLVGNMTAVDGPLLEIGLSDRSLTVGTETFDVVIGRALAKDLGFADRRRHLSYKSKEDFSCRIVRELYRTDAPGP